MPRRIEVSIIYLSDLPPGIERAVLNCRYTWSCNPKDKQLLASLPILVSSYLTFSPSLCTRQSSYFLLCNLYPRGYLRFPEFGALCCPDFPLFAFANSDGTTYCATKVMQLFVICNLILEIRN